LPEAADVTADRIDWLRILPFIALHVGCLGVLACGVSGIALAVCGGLYLLRMFAVTAFYHRYFAHRAFRTSRLLQFVFAFLGNTAAQRGPLWWASHHRKHHKHADTERDAHSPVQQGLVWSHMLWFTTRRNFPTDLKQVRDFARYPELRLLDRFDMIAPVVLVGALFAVGEVLRLYAPALGTSGWQLVVWGFFVSTTLLFHATSTINSLGHIFGRRRYATRDRSRNSFLLALLTLGEGWHNNHHHYPVAARQGFRWWEVDLTYYGLRILARLGLISDLRHVPAHVVAGQDANSAREAA
jgi:stearoyl-CoA desaturase (delta-9 desaturase)